MLDIAADKDVRGVVVDTLQRVAPGVTATGLDGTALLRDQVDLDSVDWLNFFTALEDRLGVPIAPHDYAMLSTLDALVTYLAGKRVGPGVRHPVADTTQRSTDGRIVTIRPIRGDDADRVRHFLEATSAESRYGRFHQWVAAPSAALIHFLTDIDRARCEAFVCSTGADASEAIVGEARYVATGVPGVCELGIMIDDEWRHSGIAGLLMAAVIAAARERGYRVMEGLVLAHNAPMLRFAQALGFARQPLPDDPRTVRIVLALDVDRPPRPGTAGGAD